MWKSSNAWTDFNLCYKLLFKKLIVTVRFFWALLFPRVFFEKFNKSGYWYLLGANQRSWLCLSLFLSVDFANQEGEIDSRHGTNIADAHQKSKTKTVKVRGSDSSIFTFSIPRRPRTKIKRTFKGNKVLARSKEKLNSRVFDNFLAWVTLMIHSSMIFDGKGATWKSCVCF